MKDSEQSLAAGKRTGKVILDAQTVTPRRDSVKHQRKENL
jgi:hypothetical protein